MITKIEWQARVQAREMAGNLHEFARDVLLGLADSELVPDNAWIESAAFDFSRRPYVIVRWDTENEMTLTDNYVPASSDRPE